MAEYAAIDQLAFDNIIELCDISQSYDGGKNWIIKDLNLIIEDKPNQGQFSVILGMSGSGKSTLLRYIAGLQKPTIRYQGMSKPERDAKAMEMIQLVGLDGHQHKYAQYPSLSGGQLQRVAIARSLLANADILLMDEPFGALDVRTRLQMQDLLISIWEKFHSTIVFVTHDISEAVYLADDIYILKAQPSQVVEHIDIDLPLKRSRDTKRNPRYTELVHHVEDTMMKVSHLK